MQDSRPTHEPRRTTHFFFLIFKIACLPTKHMEVHMNSFKCVRAFQIELEFGSVGFLRRAESRSTRRKTSRSKGDSQQQTQPTYGVDAGS